MTAVALRRRSLSRRTLSIGLLGVIGVSILLFALTPLAGVADFLVFSALLGLVCLAVAAWLVEGRRRAADRVAKAAAILALVLALLPLGFTLGYTIDRGLTRLSGGFLTHSMAGVSPLSANGGIYHAIVGTAEQVLLASVIAVPLGLMVAIYLSEFGHNAFGNTLRFLVDVMTGIPSIVAGLFVLAFWVLQLHRGFSGFAGALALAILELPVIIRSAEEMLRLVPGSLREAAYALGIPQWKTILRVVLPTASSGITTGVMLAVARVIGETAPVLLVVGNNNFIHTNPFNGPQASLPLYVFQGAGSSSHFDVDRAWAAALTLIVIVIVLYVAARLLTRRNALAGR